LAILLGPNNAGKSNLVDACRILFHPEAGPRARHWISVDDFAHDGAGAQLRDTFELAAELVELSAAEQARMVTCLAPSLGAGAARLKVRASLRPGGQVDMTWMGGDSEPPDVERWAREAVTFTYLHPLRDAAADLRPGRDNRLAQLLGALAPPGHADRDAIVEIIEDANQALAKVGAVKTAKTRVQDRLRDMTGKGTLGQRTDLLFADPRGSGPPPRRGGRCSSTASRGSFPGARTAPRYRSSRSPSSTAGSPTSRS
jgi:putative ATP-dependent endonuclease of OLD family